MSSRTTVTVVKTIQFRTEVLNQDGTIAHAWNNRYRSPHAAAENYTRIKISQWEHEKWEVEKYGAAYHRQTESDRQYMSKLEDRFYRLALRGFKKLLKEDSTENKSVC